MKIKMIFKGSEIGVGSKKDLISCLQFILENLDKNSPKTVFMENLGTALETVYELADLLKSEYEDDKKLLREVTNFKRKISMLRNSFPFVDSKESAITLQYNILLSFEGLGPLTGFGAANRFGDKIDHFNPERHSILT
jgi:hypothetical protein